jgi:hypothetical protein
MFDARLYYKTLTFTAAEVAANTSAEQTFTLPGVEPEDLLIAVVKPTAQAGIGIVGQRVTARDTVGITYMNTTAGGVTPTAEANVFVFLKPQPAGN